MPLVSDRRLILSGLLVLLLLAALPAEAQTRRALLVGIDTYDRGVPATRGAGTRAMWSDLEGAVNDIDAMHAVLTGRFGFERTDVRTLTNEAATRDGILAAIREHLIAASAPGDVVLFYYAGHGSQVFNSLSDESDRLDESIVPSDSNLGARDIRDKELRRLFNDLLDRGVTLTLVFDSCHSGSITRGFPRRGRLRYIAPDMEDVADAADAPAIENRGALVFSSAQDDEPASEAYTADGTPRGAFSEALVRVLRTVPTDEPAERIFHRVQAQMRGAGFSQQPVLAGSSERKRQPLFGEGPPRVGAPPVAIVDRGSLTGRLTLDAGLAAGLAVGAELVNAEGDAPLRLRVTEIRGLSASYAEVAEGDADAAQPGVLFEVERLVPSAGRALTLWHAPPLPAERLAEAAEALAAACARRRCVADPTEAPPTHLLTWDGQRWLLEAAEATALGAGLDAEALVAALPEDAELFALLPPTPELAAHLALGEGTPHDAVALGADRASAQYVLAGRQEARGLAYAWVLPAATEPGRDAVLPARSDWVAEGAPERVGAELTRAALRINGLWGWLQLDSPPPDPAFPYRFAGFERASDGRRFHLGDTLHEGDEYRPVFEADPAALRAPFPERFVYVFAVDSYGESVLIVPGTFGNVDNRIRPSEAPDAAGRFGEPVQRFAPFEIGEPYGIDNWFVLVTATPLPNPRMLEAQGIRTRGPEAADPLAALLGDVGATTRGPRRATPATWTLERLPMRSAP